jgi:hypothetical protein
MASRYSRVKTEEPSESDRDAKKAQRERIERIQSKVNAGFWVLSAGGLMYYVDFFNVALNDESVKRVPFNAAIACLTINFILYLYLSIYLPYFKKIHDAKMWEVECPNVIPTMTFFGVTCLVLTNVAFWPVWGLLTPLLVFVCMMGFLLGGHFVPSW